MALAVPYFQPAISHKNFKTIHNDSICIYMNDKLFVCFFDAAKFFFLLFFFFKPLRIDINLYHYCNNYNYISYIENAWRQYNYPSLCSVGQLDMFHFKNELKMKELHSSLECLLTRPSTRQIKQSFGMLSWRSII